MRKIMGTLPVSLLVLGGVLASCVSLPEDAAISGSRMETQKAQRLETRKVRPATGTACVVTAGDFPGSFKVPESC